MTFDELFTTATGRTAAFTYQRQFAEATVQPDLLVVPTGAGKTATAVLGWIYRRHFHPDPSVREATPRRLIYCLPMRTLCEQTFESVCNWLKTLNLLREQRPDSDTGGMRCAGRNVALHLLMGGEELRLWCASLTDDAIVIGTQDMLLSRALNRGYGSSRFAWPIEFAFLNNDCAWVFDEPQLMANGLSTSAQLAGLRDRLLTHRPCTSLWMSATLDVDWLKTVDFQRQLTIFSPQFSIVPSANSASETELLSRMNGAKRLEAALDVDFKDEKAVAAFVRAVHRNDGQTLIIVNTVDRARRLFDALRHGKGRVATTSNLLLLHSRYRTAERRKLNAQLRDREASKDRIIVATQVVEAGVDISARTLITELAPWTSLVQRMGRCNRLGSDTDARVYWLDLAATHAMPYDPDDLDRARRILSENEKASVSPRSLQEISAIHKMRPPFREANTLRKRDLLDLYDTATDLSGNDVDVQRFVRGEDVETDVAVYWRDLDQISQPTAPHRDEICNVPIGELKKFLKNGANRRLTRYWDFLESEWRVVRDPERDVKPAQTLCLHVSLGGYSELGWDPKSGTRVEVVAIDDDAQPEGTADDPLSSQSAAVTLAAHSEHVLREVRELIRELHVPDDCRFQLESAALWHDIGKAHEVFQAALLAVNPELDPNQLWAKTGRRARILYARPYFRHELASALAALQAGVPFLSAYLIAAHHGRVRLTIRPAPEEPAPKDDQTLFALGIRSGDVLPQVDLCGLNSPAVELNLAPMMLGGESSWTDNVLQLVETWGPFRLAWTEAILRIADQVASAKEVTP